MSGFHEDDKLATGQWADPYSLGDKYAFEEGMFFQGRHPGNHAQAIGSPVSGHVLLNAETQQDKGRSIVIPNIILWPGSVFVTSPKPDTMEITAAGRGPGDEYCTGRGQKLVCLDPMQTARIDPKFRAYFNPVPKIDPKNPMRMATRIVDAYTIPGNESEPHWDQSSIPLGAIGAAHLRTGKYYRPEDWNLVTLYKKLLAGNVEDSLQLAQLCGEGNQDAIDLCRHGLPDGFMLFLEEMTLNPADDGFIALAAQNYLRQAKENPRYLESIRGTALHHLRFCLLKEIRDNLTGEGFTEDQEYDPAELKARDGGVSVYVTLPSADRALATGWEKMVVKLSMDACKDDPEPPKTGHKVMFSLDEFLGYSRVRDVENGATEYASAGVLLFLAVQKLGSLHDTYKDNWETFVGAASSFLSFGMREHFTLKYVRDLLGEMEVRKVVHGTNDTTNKQVANSEQRTDTESTTTGIVTTNTTMTGGGSTETRNSGESWSSGGGQGSATTPGRLIELYKGHNRNTNWSRNSNSSTSKGTQQNFSNSDSEAHQQSTTRSTAFTYGKTVTHGKTVGRTTQESFHKRPLCDVNELRVEFASQGIYSEDWRYPGFILVIEQNSDPFPVRKCYYDQDPLCEGRFTPDRNHEFIPLYAQPMLEHMYTDDHLFDFCLPADLKAKGYRLLPAAGVEAGEVIEAGRPFAQLIGPRDHTVISDTFPWLVEPKVFSLDQVMHLQLKDYGLIDEIKAPMRLKIVELGSIKNHEDDFSFLVRREERLTLPARAFDQENERLIDLADHHVEMIEDAAHHAHRKAIEDRDQEERRRQLESRWTYKAWKASCIFARWSVTAVHAGLNYIAQKRAVS